MRPPTYNPNIGADDGDAFSIKVPLPNLFKALTKLGMSAELFDEELYAIKYRHHVILKIISAYMRKNLQIGSIDPEMFLNEIPRSQSGFVSST